MNDKANDKQRASWMAMAVVALVGGLLAWGILLKDRPGAGADGHGGHADEAPSAHAATVAKGPHGGRLFTSGAYSLELTIFENGVPPEFRLYTYQGGKLLSPGESQVQVTVERLGRSPQLVHFKPRGDHLLGDAEVFEPHSFKLTIEAAHGGARHRFSHEQEEARVSMSDARLKEAGVTVAVAGPARIDSQLALLGEVHYNGDRTVQVVSRFAGLVDSVAANAGDTVRKGQVLAVLFSPALADQRAQAVVARQRLGLAQATYAREKKLWEDKISAEQDYQQARAALQEAELADQAIRQKLAGLGIGASSGGKLTSFALRSPIDGVVTDKRIAVGQSLDGTEMVFTVSDLSSVWVEAPVATKDLAAVRVGQGVRLRSNAFEGEAQGRIAYVSALVGEQTRSATARVVLPNPQGLWRPGLPVGVNVISGQAEVPVAVRVEAIQSLRDWQVVFGRYGGYLEARPLQLGRSDGRFVEVLDGLAAGERYAAANSFMIKAELGKAGASHDH